MNAQSKKSSAAIVDTLPALALTLFLIYGMDADWLIALVFSGVGLNFLLDKKELWEKN